jgi:hypothetical protein
LTLSTSTRKAICCANRSLSIAADYITQGCG